jgi:hypothetical protein
MFNKGILQNMGGGVTKVAATSPKQADAFFSLQTNSCRQPQKLLAGLHIGVWV